MKLHIIFLIFLVTLTCCQTVSRFADIIYVVDEGIPRDSMMWMDNSIIQLEDRLTGSGIGDNPSHNNLYGLVLFGGEGGTHVRRVLGQNNTELATARVFYDSLINVLGSLQPTDGNHDGYAGLDRALDTVFRAGSVRIIIFMTDRPRDVVYRNITLVSLITRMVDAQIILNEILNVSIISLTPSTTTTDNSNTSFLPVPGLGVIYSNQMLSSYFVLEGSHNLDTTQFVEMVDTNTSSSLIFDYGLIPVILSNQIYTLPIPSSIWQLNYTFDNTTNQGQAFNEAFFHNMAFEIQQFNLTRVPCQTCQGNLCYFVPDLLVTHNRAFNVCTSRGARLADISNQNQLNPIRSQYNQPFWINRYQNNTSNQCYLVVGTNVNPISCNQLYPVLCEVPRSPLISC